MAGAEGEWGYWSVEVEAESEMVGGWNYWRL